MTTSRKIGRSLVEMVGQAVPPARAGYVQVKYSIPELRPHNEQPLPDGRGSVSCFPSRDRQGAVARKHISELMKLRTKPGTSQARVPGWLPARAVLACAVAARAEVVTLTLRQAVELAGKQNPDLALARALTN